MASETGLVLSIPELGQLSCREGSMEEGRPLLVHDIEKLAGQEHLLDSICDPRARGIRHGNLEAVRLNRAEERLPLLSQSINVSRTAAAG